jgi:SAM-dependent methyltransferase
MATSSLRRPAAELSITSFIVLFQELALIRWLSGEVRVLAYFPNVVLISAFLGLGIGAIRAGKRSLLWLWPASMAAITAAAVSMGRIAFTNANASEHLWLLYFDIPNAPVVHDIRPPLVIAFILSAISFIALGQIMGERLRDFTAVGATLWGYVADLSGSLLGVIAFAIASFFRTFPVVWFAVVLTAGAWLFATRSRRGLAIYAVVAVAILATINAGERAGYYSPYYALSTGKKLNAGGIVVLANGSFHQYAAPLARRDVVTSASDAIIRKGYPIPYEYLPARPRRVLVLGAGTGNDVATALDNGAEEVDAVEIDPVILQLGRLLHPDRPYDSRRVHVINTDAREFLRNTDRKYDLIVFGTLDSMTKLSALSNVRLDNFVYTVECMKTARQRLTSRGGLALYFMVANQSIHMKLWAMLTEAFGEPPVVWKGSRMMFNEIFLAGPAWARLHAAEAPLDAKALKVAELIDVPSDDWPYLYLNARAPSSFYVSMLLIFLVISAGALGIAAPELVRGSYRGFDAEMFLFGAAFLLLETKLATQMSLVWGTTWVTSAVVFGSILLTILIGTTAMQIRPMPYAVAAVALVVSLLITYVIPMESLLLTSVPARLLASLLFAGTPVFFASICFAIRFRLREASNLAFGWNLAGAVFGGLVEFMSMVTGIRAMALVALMAYLLTFLIAKRSASYEDIPGSAAEQVRS